jgi:extracellular elastinolytic metalloproteinase
MLKRTAAILALALVVGIQPATAAPKKKKSPKPYKSEEVTLGIPHTVVYGSTGSVNSVTAKEFENGCAVPSSNGFDAYVFEVPKSYQKVQGFITAVGAPSQEVNYDIDMFLYDANCAVTLAFQAVGNDESGVLPKGTAWILIHAYEGEPNLSAHIELKV